MSPLSPGVLGTATLVSSPALWLGLVDRTLPLDVALTRYLVAVVICWALLSVVTTWAFPDPGSVRTGPAKPDTDDRRERTPEGTVHDNAGGSSGVDVA